MRTDTQIKGNIEYPKPLNTSSLLSRTVPVHESSDDISHQAIKNKLDGFTKH